MFTSIFVSDFDECSFHSPCEHECNNLEGSYECLCPSGYRLDVDGHSCIGKSSMTLINSCLHFADIDECVELGDQCGNQSLCFNQLGSFQCIDNPCPPGYELDKVNMYVDDVNCIDINC